MSRTELIKPLGDIKIILFSSYRAMKGTWVINKKENGTFMGLNSTWSIEEKSGGNYLLDGSAKIHVYHQFKSRWGKEEPCQKWLAASENWEAVSDRCVSISVAAMKEQEGGWDGVSSDHEFAVRKKVTHCEVFHYWRLGEVFRCVAFHPHCGKLEIRLCQQ